MEVFKVSLITIIQQEASILEVSFILWASLSSVQRPLFVIGRLERRINKMAPGDDGKGNLLLLFLSKSPAGTSAEERV